MLNSFSTWKLSGRKVRLNGVLGFRESGNEAEIGGERMICSDAAQTLGSGEEDGGGIGEQRVGRCRFRADAVKPRGVPNSFIRRPQTEDATSGNNR